MTRSIGATGTRSCLMDKEVEMESRLVAIEGGYHGHEGMRRWWEDFLGTFPDYQIEIEEMRDLGDVTLSHFKGWGHSGGEESPDRPDLATDEVAPQQGGLGACLPDRVRSPRSRRAVGVTARSRRDLDHRQSESLPFICEWVEAVALLPQAWRDTARAMSQENVEIVRAALEALTRGDVDSTFKDAAPDATIDLSRAVGSGPRRLHLPRCLRRW